MSAPSESQRAHGEARGAKILYVVTEDWYFCSHRLPIARAARDAGFRVSVATRVNAHGDVIRREGFGLVPLRMKRRGSGPWNELATLRELVALYRAERPDIVHHVAMKPVVYGSIAARFAGVRGVVNALAGFGYVFTSRRAGARLLRPVLRMALRALLGGEGSRVIVQNPDDRALVRSLGVADGRIVEIRGSGVDCREFSPSPQPDAPVVACMVSRMLWDKGVGELVAAARRLATEHPAVRVVLVGPPDPENPASVPGAQLRAWHEQGVVDWQGQRDDVAEVWRRSHIAVLPSHREGLPKSLIEAAASGRPMIACDVPGSREIVVDGVTGLLVPSHDAHALTEAIARLAADASLRERLGGAARALVVGKFSSERIAGETLALYRSVMAQPCPVSSP